jgi:hypothetical protein
MTDNIAITAGSGTTVATDDVGGVHYQRVKLVDGTLDSPAAIPGDATYGLDVDVTRLPVAKGQGFSIPVTLTVTNGAYSIGDVVGGLITLPNIVSANGKRSIIYTITLAGVVAIPYELWFFNADIATPRTDNAVFGLAAADGAKFLGAVPILASDYLAAQTAFNNATLSKVGLTIQGVTTSIYAYLKATEVTSPGTTTLYLNVAGEFID